MALTLNFAGMTLKYPSGSGPTTCKGCGGHAYASYGTDKDGNFFHSESCLEGWDHKTKTYAKCTKSLIGTSNSDTV